MPERSGVWNNYNTAAGCSISEMAAAKAEFVPRKASEEETAAFKGEVDKIKASANKKYTAESLKVYQDALAAAEASGRRKCNEESIG